MPSKPIIRNAKDREQIVQWAETYTRRVARKAARNNCTTEDGINTFRFDMGHMAGVWQTVRRLTGMNKADVDELLRPAPAKRGRRGK